MEKHYEISSTFLGPGADQEAKYLNRILRWTSDGLEYEGDPKHAQILLREWGMVDCLPMDCPISKDTEERLGEGDKLGEQEVRPVRRAIARLNYMAQGRPDLSVCSRLLS